MPNMANRITSTSLGQFDMEKGINLLSNSQGKFAMEHQIRTVLDTIPSYQLKLMKPQIESGNLDNINFGFPLDDSKKQMLKEMVLDILNKKGIQGGKRTRRKRKYRKKSYSKI